MTRFQEGLQVQLRTRYRRLYKSDYVAYSSELRYLRDWIRQQPALLSILSAVERAEPELDADAWYAGLERRGGIEWPDSEVGRAKVVWRVLVRIADGDLKTEGVGWNFSGERNLNDALRDFTDSAVEALVEYLEQRLSAESDMLYVLERYRRRVLWWEQARLWAEYEQDPSRGEALYDADLRRFLFEQGVDYPYSQPASPSGKADIVADLDGDDPLTCEVKLYDGGSYGPSYVAKGLQQALRYAHDYSKVDAYLVIYNISDKQLNLPTDDESKEWPPRLHVGGVTIFLVVVQAKPQPPASKSGKTTTTTITRAQLVIE